MTGFKQATAVLRKPVNKEEVHNLINKINGWPLINNRLFVFALVSLLLFIFLFEAHGYFYTWDMDSPSFYTAASGILKNRDIYDQKEFMHLADSIFGKSRMVYPYLYWPVLAQIFIPLTYLDYPEYFTAVLIINILLTFLCVYFIFILLDKRENVPGLCVIFLFLTITVNRPLQMTLHHGQVNLLALAALLLSLYLLKEKKEYPSSLLLSLAVFTKIYPLIFLGLFLLQKKIKYVFYAALNSAIIFMISLAVFQKDSWLAFADMAVNNFFYGRKTAFFFDFNANWANISLNGLISQLFIRFGIPRMFVFPALSIVIAACAILLYPQIKRVIKNRDLLFTSSIILSLSLVVSTISWIHHYVLMLLPINYLFFRIMRDKRYGYLVPHLILTSMILLHPESGGLPINQTALIATIFFIGLIYLYKHTEADSSEKNKPAPQLFL